MEIQNQEYKFICENCNYKTNRSFDYNNHLLSIRHKTKHSKLDTFICEYCEKNFKTQSGLWKHNTKCKNKNRGYEIDPTMIENIMVKIQNKNFIIKENTKQTETTQSNISLLNLKCTNMRDIKDIFNDIRIDIKTFMDDFYSLEYENVIEKIFKNTFMNISLLKRSIYCFENENPDMEVCYFYHNNTWIRETELQWMNQIAYETNDDYPDEKQTILLNIMQLFTDNIIRDIKKYKNIDLERKIRAAIEFIPTRMFIIQKLINIVKVNNNIFL
jgi:hypothetical protein